MRREATSAAARAGATRAQARHAHARAIESKHQNENDQHSERGAREDAASPFGSIDAGIDLRPDDCGFELGGRAEAAGERKAGTFGTALQRQHFRAEPRWYPGTPHAFECTAASVNE